MIGIISGLIETDLNYMTIFTIADTYYKITCLQYLYIIN